MCVSAYLYNTIYFNTIQVSEIEISILILFQKWRSGRHFSHQMRKAILNYRRFFIGWTLLDKSYATKIWIKTCSWGWVRNDKKQPPSDGTGALHKLLILKGGSRRKFTRFVFQPKFRKQKIELIIKHTVFRRFNRRIWVCRCHPQIITHKLNHSHVLEKGNQVRTKLEVLW